MRNKTFAILRYTDKELLKYHTNKAFQITKNSELSNTWAIEFQTLFNLLKIIRFSGTCNKLV